MARRHIAQRALRAAVCGIETLENRQLLSGTDVLSYHGSTPASNGVNATEVQLTPGNVTVSSFGKQFSVDVTDLPNTTGIPSAVLNSSINYTARSGQVYAEPLVKTGVTIATGPYAGTVHDVVFVATQLDSLFAIDANGGTVLWKDSFIYNASGNPNPLNGTIAAGITAVPGGFGTETNSQDISPWIGIVGTPVIDPAGQFIYLTAKTREAVNSDQSNPHYVYRLHKVRLSDGSDTNVVIADTTYHTSNGTFTYNSGPSVVGNGDGSVSGRITFNAVRQMDRPALELVNGRIYTAWASHGDNTPYHGWVLTFDANTLAINGAFNTTPNSSEGEGGIWQGGGSVVFDDQGNFYMETGNGKFDGDKNPTTGQTTGLDANGFPVNGDYGDSFLKLALDPTSTQANQSGNKNGWGIKVVDYFSPFNNHALDNADRDLGSGGPIVLPDSAGSPAHPHLLVGSGKEGKIYLIDRDNMGKFDPNTDHIVQEVGSAINGSLDVPAYFNGRLYYTAGYGGQGASWQLTGGMISTGSQQLTTDSFGFPGSSPYISASGTLNGIAWMVDKGTGQLRAYDAGNLTKELWNSSQNAARDSLGSSVKFSVATPVNGRVYVGTSGQLVCYGPPVPPSSGPADPTTLTAAATGASTIFLTWQDNSNNEDGFKIERSSDGTNFTDVGSAGVNQTSYTDSGLSPQAKYYYRVRAYNAFNTLTYSAYTNVASASTTALGSQAPIDLYHFDEGAGATTADSAGNNPGTLIGATKPAWVTPGRVGSAALSFTGDNRYQSNNESAVQLAHDLSPILGGTSSLAAWIKTTSTGNDTHWEAPAITGVEQAGGGNDISWGYLTGSGHIALAVGDNANIAVSTNAINDGKWHHVAFSRDAGTGVIKLYVDGVLNATATSDSGMEGLKTSQFSLIGAQTDVQGDGSTFAGANFLNAQLDDVRIYNQVLDPAEVAALALPPTAPTNLVAKPTSGTEIDLTWTDNATTESGYKLERSINGGPFIQVPQLPAGTTMYMDTGLTPGTPYSYRVRATNSAGDSAYSNTASLTTPTPPATPTDAAATFVATNEIDLKWTDKANNEMGYRVFRRAGAGAQFTQVGSLPPDSTSFKDTTVQPGVNYDYHIQAYNLAGYSDFTGISIQSLAAAPANVSAALSGGAVLVKWDASSGATGYNVYRSTTPGGEGATPLASNVTGMTFSDTGVTSGATYYYKVTAVDGSGEGPRSAEASAHAAITPGDFNGDGLVNFADLLILAQNYGKTAGATLSQGDANGDGKIDFSDLLILAQNYGAGSPGAVVAAVPRRK